MPTFRHPSDVRALPRPVAAYVAATNPRAAPFSNQSDLWISSRLGIDSAHPFFHLRAIVARSPHAVPREVGLSGRQAR